SASATGPTLAQENGRGQPRKARVVIACGCQRNPVFPALDRAPTHSLYPAMEIPVLVIDFGSQVTQLIVRRVRESGVYCEVVPAHAAEAALARIKPKAIILSGGPASVLDAASPRPPAAAFEMGVPVLGICYGQQA